MTEGSMYYYYKLILGSIYVGILGSWPTMTNKKWKKRCAIILSYPHKPSKP